MQEMGEHLMMQGMPFDVRRLEMAEALWVADWEIARYQIIRMMTLRSQYLALGSVMLAVGGAAAERIASVYEA